MKTMIRFSNRAFTLVELVVVLAAIAILTHLAVRELGAYSASRRAIAADSLMEEIAAASYSPGEATSFFHDMGRLPQCVDIAEDSTISSAAPTNGTLAELWMCPPLAKPFAIINAVDDNLCVAEEEKGDLVDENVWIGTGWRGPYLRLPVGKTRLFDPWGNEFREEDSAHLRRIWTTNNVIYAVSHYGQSAQSRGRKDMKIAPDGVNDARLVIYLEKSESTAQEANGCAWYGPSSGSITGCFQNVISSSPVVFNGVFAGPKIIVVRRGNAVLKYAKIDIPPGGTTFHVKY